MVQTRIITPKVVKGFTSRQTNLGIDSYDFDELYSSDTGLWKSKVLDIGSPKYPPQKATAPTRYIFDRSRYNNHGSITGATWSQLPSGVWCLYYDGSSKVNLGTDTSLDIGDLNTYTIIVWFKTPDITGNGMAIAFGNDGNNWPNVRLGYNNGTLEANHRADDTTAATLTGSAIINDTWYHAAFVRRAAANFELYQDGISIDTDATAGVGATTLNTFYLGTWVRIGDVLTMLGSVGEVLVYNTNLNQEQIRQNFLITKWAYGK